MKYHYAVSPEQYAAAETNETVEAQRTLTHRVAYLEQAVEALTEQNNELAKRLASLCDYVGVVE